MPWGNPAHGGVPGTFGKNQTKDIIRFCVQYCYDKELIVQEQYLKVMKR